MCGLMLSWWSSGSLEISYFPSEVIGTEGSGRGTREPWRRIIGRSCWHPLMFFMNNACHTAPPHRIPRLPLGKGGLGLRPSQPPPTKRRSLYPLVLATRVELDHLVAVIAERLVA
jgi:hypothetical protein